MTKVLLLEDDRDMGMLLRTLLEIEGYLVATYDPALPAVEQAKAEAPDLILLDVHLGGQDGMQILRDIRAMPSMSGMRIVMTSGINLSDQCLRDGANAFIAKPYMPEHLLQMLKKVLAAPPTQAVPVEPPKPSPASFPKVF
jgi:CheY-like chemotaxis protein